MFDFVNDFKFHSYLYCWLILFNYVLKNFVIIFRS